MRPLPPGMCGLTWHLQLGEGLDLALAVGGGADIRARILGAGPRATAACGSLGGCQVAGSCPAADTPAPVTLAAAGTSVACLGPHPQTQSADSVPSSRSWGQ